MSEEIKRVLRMVDEGKVSVAEGTELIELIQKRASEAPVDADTYAKKSIRVRIFEENESKVNVTIPLKLVQVLVKFGKGIASMIPDAQKYLRDADFDTITEAIEQQEEGDIIDLETEEGDRVLITIE